MVASIASNTVQAALSGSQATRGQKSQGTQPETNAMSNQGTPSSETPAANPAAVPKIDSEALEAAVRDMVQSAQSLQRSLLFSVDETSGRTIITVIDKETEEVIRQIPPEEVLTLAEHFKQSGRLLGGIEA